MFGMGASAVVVGHLGYDEMESFETIQGRMNQELLKEKFGLYPKVDLAALFRIPNRFLGMLKNSCQRSHTTNVFMHGPCTCHIPRIASFPIAAALVPAPQVLGQLP